MTPDIIIQRMKHGTMYADQVHSPPTKLELQGVTLIEKLLDKHNSLVAMYNLLMDERNRLIEDNERLRKELATEKAKNVEGSQVPDADTNGTASA